MPHEILKHLRDTSKSSPENYSSVYMRFARGDSYEGYFMNNQWYFVEYNLDDTFKIAAPVNEPVSAWCPLHLAQSFTNYIKPPKLVVQELLMDFEEHLTQTQPIAAKPSPFYHNTLTPGVVTCLHTETKHRDRLIYNIWQSYLKIANSSITTVKPVFLCSSYRSPNHFLAYALNQWARFEAYQPLSKDYTPHELRVIKEASEQLLTLPIHILRLNSFNKAAIQNIKNQIEKKSPGLVLIETLGPPSVSVSPQLKPHMAELEATAHHYQLSIVIITTTPDQHSSSS